MPPKPKVKTGGKPEDVWKRTKGKEEEVEEEEDWSSDDGGKKGKKKGGKKASAPPPPPPAAAVVEAPSKSKKPAAAPEPKSKAVKKEEPVVSKKEAAPPPPSTSSKEVHIVHNQVHSASEKPVVCRLKLQGHTFETLCFPQRIKDFRDGKCSLDQVCADVDAVFKNASRGEKYSMKELETVFETNNMVVMLERIISKGTAQVSAEEMREDVANKRREVLAYLHAKYVDPKTNKPHPITRIESGLDQIKGFAFDPKKSTQDLSQDLVKKMIAVGLAMKKSEIEGYVVVKKDLHGSVQALLQKMGCTVFNTSYTAEGAKLTVGVHPADVEHMNKELERLTKGDFSFEMMEAVKKPGSGKD